MYKEFEKYELGSGVVLRILKHIDAGIYVGTSNCTVVIQPNGYPVVRSANARTAPGSYVKVRDLLELLSRCINAVVCRPMHNKMK